jgi:cellulose synthase (UDP-forming)
MYTPISIVATLPNLIRQIQLRLQQQTLLLRLLAVGNLGVGGWYLSWRITDSMHLDALWLGIPLFLAELYSYGGGILFVLNLWQPPLSPIASWETITSTLSPETVPTVDVVISGNCASIATLEKTVRAALALDYPIPRLTVYLLHSGDSLKLPELQSLVQRLATEDLQTPALQQVYQEREGARSRLLCQQKQLEYLIPEISQAETCLESFRYDTITDLSVFSDILPWFDSLKPDYIPLRTWLECQTALSEAFTNAVEHAHRHQPPDTPIHLEVALLTHSVQIRIFDYGLPFDFQQALKGLPLKAETMTERGRGLMILQQLADYLNYIPLEDGRNCFVFLKSYLPIPEAKEGNLPLSGYLTSFDQAWRLLHPQTKIYDTLVTQQDILREYQRQDDELNHLSRCRLLLGDQQEQLRGDFLLILNGDQIPKQEFLRQVLPYFYPPPHQNNGVGFVQTRQSGDSLLTHPDSPQDFQGIKPGFAIETNTILRRKALTPKGFSFLQNQEKQSIETAIELDQQGWESVYHNEMLAEAVFKPELVIQLKQQLHQVQGRLQGLCQGKPWGNSQLSFGQQLRWLQLLYRYGSGFFTLIFLLCPIFYSFGGILPVDSYDVAFLSHFIPVYLVTRLSFLVATWGTTRGEIWQAEQNAIALFPIFLQGFLPPIPHGSNPLDYLRLVVPQWLLFVLTLTALGWSTYQFYTGQIEGAIAYSFNAIWASYNLFLLGGMLRVTKGGKQEVEDKREPR